MSLSQEGNMVMPVSPMGGYGYGGNDMFGGGIWWFLIIFVIAIMNGGWGNMFGGYGSGATNAVNNDIQRGFDQQATMGGISDINAAIVALSQAQCQGFASVNAAIASSAAAAEANATARQMAIMQQMYGLSSQFADCCCENRLAVANLSAQIASDGAATRANTDAKVQMVMDKLCQLELDGIKQNYENRIAGMQNQIDALRDRVTNQGFEASQAAQTATIVRTLDPTPVPAYPVQNPNGCPCGNRFGYAVA